MPMGSLMRLFILRSALQGFLAEFYPLVKK